MRTEFALPDLGEEITEGELVVWHVKPGETIGANSLIAEIETDRGSVGLTAPYDGTIAELHAKEGEIVPVDEALVVFDVEERKVTEPADQHVFAPPRVRRLAREHGVDLTSIEPNGDRISEQEVLEAVGEHPTKPEPGPPTSNRERIHSTPSRQSEPANRVDITPVHERDGTTGDAYARAAEVLDHTTDEATPKPSISGTTAPEGLQPGDRIPPSGVRRTSDDRMVDAKVRPPHLRHHDEAEVSSLVEIRERLEPLAEELGINLTGLPFAVKSVNAALRAVPAMNAALDAETDEIILHDEHKLGIAVATEDGQVVPVIENVDQKGLLEIAREIDDKMKRARNRTIGVKKRQEATFTIMNVGALGGQYVSPVLTGSAAAMLALGEMKQRPWVANDEVVVRPTIPLSLTADHRLVDVAEAALFTNAVKRYLHDPQLLLFE